MKFLLHLKLLHLFNKKSGKRNFVMVILFLLTNIIAAMSFAFLFASQNLEVKMRQSYYEHLSVSVTSYVQTETNHKLINVKQYRRPEYNNLLSIMDYSGEFSVKPDYSYFFRYLSLSLFAKEIETPTFVLVADYSNSIYINRHFEEQIKKDFSLDQSLIGIDFSFNYIFDEGIEINDEFTLFISKVIDEPNYFASNKIYLPQNIVDEIIGNYFVNDSKMANYIFNLPNDHHYTNFQYVLHFPNEQTYLKFINIITDSKTNEHGLELVADHLTKVLAISSLFDYLEIIIVIFLVITIIGVMTILIMIVSSLFIVTTRQSALLLFLGATKGDAISIFLSLVFKNYLLSSVYLLFFPKLMVVINNYIFEQFRIGNFFNLTVNNFVLMYFLIALFIFISTLFLMSVKFKRPLFYLLLDD